MAICDQWRFGNDVFDLSEVVALVGRTVYLRDGRNVGVGDAAADALREATPVRRAPPQDAPCNIHADRKGEGVSTCRAEAQVDTHPKQ